MTTVRELMSFGVLTVQPDELLGDVVGKLRRIGHEGYPVLKDNQIIGLLTARDMNRATENNLQHLKIHDVMLTGNIFVSPNESLSVLLRKMVETEWGQIPVIENNVLTGIVTRTDIIKHYAELETRIDARHISHEEFKAILGQSVAALIAFIAKQANERKDTIYIVGGVVRDLLLQRSNLDIDFAIESNAIDFAHELQKSFGGTIDTHEAFITAKWRFDETTATHIGYPLESLPEYVDLVTARHEFYEEPAVLPTVYNSGIKLDLRRRDFTINALAIKLKSNGVSGSVIDLFGGLHDLEKGVIRALHSLSFADDPTRTLRAVRYSHRLGFEIEPRTATLIETALPMMKRITGERLKNEFTLLLKEHEPEIALLRLEQMGVLQAIHPEFILKVETNKIFQQSRDIANHPVEDFETYQWMLLAICLKNPHSIDSLAERLIIGKRQANVMKTAATMIAHPNQFLVGKPSEITLRLEAQLGKQDNIILNVVYGLIENKAFQQTIEQFLNKWRYTTPTTNGNALKALGLKPGPQFKHILQELRNARIDGKIISDEDEKRYLHQLIESI